MSIAPYIDHTVLKPDTTIKDIEKVCKEAIEYTFASVCIPPYFVKDACRLLQPSKMAVATVIGFPFGYSHFNAKKAEAQQAIDEGATELDMVMNIAAFKNNDIKYLTEEIETVANLCRQNGVLLKVIVETALLSEEELIKCCHFYQQFPIQFLKTSTGYASAGATIEGVRLMRAHLPPSIKVKASGGIKTFEFAQQLIQAGASRLGCSASVAIVSGSGGSREGY